MSALEPIFTEYYRKLEVTAISILRDKKDGQDAASEAMMRVISYAKNHDGFRVEHPAAFMYTTVRNIAYDMLDRGKRLVGLDSADDIAADESLYDSAEVTAAILSLPKPEREVGVMFYIYGCKIREIADSLDMPPGTVKWHISKIKKLLSEKFK